MLSKLQKIGFYGNPYIGLFMKTNSKITLMPEGKPDKFSRVCQILGTQDVSTNVFGSPLAGLYSIMNDKGILFSKVILDEEINNVKRKIKEYGIDIKIDILDTEFTALSNNVVVNNKISLINPKMKEKSIINKIRDILDVEVETIELEKFNVVGSIIFANDKGFVAHPGLNEEELDKIEEKLGVPGGVSTANSGVPFVSLCIVGNNHSIVFGENTTAFEQQRIIDSLGYM